MNIQKLKREKGPLYRRAYTTYQNMKHRCVNSKDSHYSRYGGRGIELKIDREDFITWYIRESQGRMDLTIDRIDNDGHYELGNMQLITKSENIKKAWEQFPERLKVAVSKNGLKGAEVLSRPIQVGGVKYISLRAAARSLGKSPSMVHKYLQKGITTSGLEAGYIQ